VNGGARPLTALVVGASVAVTAVTGLIGCGRTALDLGTDPQTEHRPDASSPRDASALRDGPPLRPALLRFAVIGDYGVDSVHEARVARMVSGWNPDFVITTGDNNYPAGEASTIDANIGKYYGRFIGDYHGAYGPGGAVNRFWPSPGNHDWDSDLLAPYLDYFTLPGNERYYDVVVGPVHLFAVDSDDREPDGNSEDSAQARWLETALAASSSCFDVVYFHHPAYSSGPHGSTINMRWPFENWGADVVFAGHDHVYERSRVGGIRHFTIGLSGNEAYAFATPVPESEVRFSGQRGALLASVRDDGMTFQFFADDGREIDSYTAYGPCSQ